jgi:multicomponent Na+:H+ antiporter subunit E
MKRKIVLFLTALVAWVLLNWPPDVQHLIVGVFAAALVAYLTGDLFIRRPFLLRHPHRYSVFFFQYLPVFLWEVIKANVDVAYRVIHPRLPIRPGIVKVKTSLKTDTGLTFLANSITLTPGTMTVDVDRANGFLYIHWIDVGAQDVEAATRKVVERFEKILSKIFE